MEDFKCPIHEKCISNSCVYYRIKQWKQNGQDFYEYKKLYAEILNCIGKMSNYFSQNWMHDINAKPKYYPKVAATAFVLRWNLDQNLLKENMKEKMREYKTDIMKELQNIAPSFEKIFKEII